MSLMSEKLHNFAHATFLLRIVNLKKNEFEIDVDVNARHIKCDFIQYITEITIDLADRNKLFSKAIFNFINRIKTFDEKQVLELIIYIKNNYIDDFNRQYKKLKIECKEIKKLKVAPSNRVQIITKINNFNKLSQSIHSTYLDLKDGFLDYIINYLELLEIEYNQDIKKIMPLKDSDIEYITNTKEYINNIFGNYRKLAMSINDLSSN